MDHGKPTALGSCIRSAVSIQTLTLCAIAHLVDAPLRTDGFEVRVLERLRRREPHPMVVRQKAVEQIERLRRAEGGVPLEDELAPTFPLMRTDGLGVVLCRSQKNG